MRRSVETLPPPPIRPIPPIGSKTVTRARGPLNNEPRQATGTGGTEVAPGVTAPPAALRFQFARSGGPGGQNVNKLNTKAELWVSVDALIGLRPGARERLKQAAGRRLTAAG